jgi:hypothetical protein
MLELRHIVVPVLRQNLDFKSHMSWYFIQIYHVWEGYLRKKPVERRKISRAEWRGKFSLKTGNVLQILLQACFVDIGGIVENLLIIYC